MSKQKSKQPSKPTSISDRKNGKASKKRPKAFDATKRRLVTREV